MAKMNGCNAHMGGTNGAASAQGKGRTAPSSFARNSLSKGGVNTDLGGGAGNRKASVGAGGASQGKYKNMPRGR